MALPKRVVYVLKSASDPRRYHTGLTSNLSTRLDAHNAGRCSHTSSGRPWTVDVVVEFTDERRALAFEHYLKSGSRGGVRNAPSQMTNSRCATMAVGAPPTGLAAHEGAMWEVRVRPLL
jgi:predicted GIY-YIG superfamily endonuclease